MLDTPKKRRKPVAQKPRIRLDQAQKSRLELRYQRNPNWSNEDIEELSNLINVPFTKVYKWNWECKKKDHKHFSLYDLAAMYPEVGVPPTNRDIEETVSENVGKEE